MSTIDDNESRKQLHDAAYAARLHELEEPRRLKAVLAHHPLPTHAVILDVGCGSGALAEFLGDSIGEYHGVDFSAAFIDRARERFGPSGDTVRHFHCMDVVDFVAGNPGRFDRVYALDVSEHVPDEEWAAMVAAFHRALKPGGMAIIHTPNLDFLIERMKQHNVLLKQFPEHIAVRTAAGNAAFFKRAGFRSVTTTRLPHYNVLRFLHPLNRVPLIGRWFAARLLIGATR